MIAIEHTFTNGELNNSSARFRWIATRERTTANSSLVSTPLTRASARPYARAEGSVQEEAGTSEPRPGGSVESAGRLEGSRDPSGDHEDGTHRSRYQRPHVDSPAVPEAL